MIRHPLAWIAGLLTGVVVTVAGSLYLYGSPPQLAPAPVRAALAPVATALHALPHPWAVAPVRTRRTAPVVRSRPVPMTARVSIGPAIPGAPAAVDRALGSVAMVTFPDPAHRGWVYEGTTWALSDAGGFTYWATDAHVVLPMTPGVPATDKPDGPYSIQRPGHPAQPADLLGTAANTDLALLRTRGLDRPLPIEAITQPGTRVWSLWDAEVNLTGSNDHGWGAPGQIVTTAGPGTFGATLITTPATPHGSCGGPVVTASGAVTGLVEEGWGAGQTGDVPVAQLRTWLGPRLD